MNADLKHLTQKESANRAFSRVIVSRLARRMAHFGVLRTLAKSVAGYFDLFLSFPSQHLHRSCDSAISRPLRRSGVAAGGAGGGGPGGVWNDSMEVAA